MIDAGASSFSSPHNGFLFSAPYSSSHSLKLVYCFLSFSSFIPYFCNGDPFMIMTSKLHPPHLFVPIIEETFSFSFFCWIGIKTINSHGKAMNEYMRIRIRKECLILWPGEVGYFPQLVETSWNAAYAVMHKGTSWVNTAQCSPCSPSFPLNRECLECKRHKSNKKLPLQSNLLYSVFTIRKTFYSVSDKELVWRKNRQTALKINTIDAESRKISFQRCS